MPVRRGRITGLYCTIKGRVVDDRSNPQIGIDIEWDISRAGYFRSLTKTDSEGNFTVKLAPIPEGESEQIIKAIDKIESREQILRPLVNPFDTVNVTFTI